MLRVARFYKVSPEQFSSDWEKAFPGTPVPTDITLPTRATAGSAGYDFRAPADLTLAPGETALIPTGIRCRMEEGWVLLIYPRSGLGFKYRLQLNNTVGVIDSDYFNAKNEGHIMLKLTNDSNEGKTLTIHAGDGIAQGIFTPYGITEDDESEAVREGGFGSTGR